MRPSPAKYNLAIPFPADYKSAIPSCQVQLGAPMSAAARMSLFAQLRRLRHFLHSERDATRSQSTVLH